ncbi:hypothetical protein [Patulibacter defluvii]|uniref:hypothetical protein n=1 Tax=Patulibacter defluvii TaxID=3095358 RepID=UPI002A74EF0D|nr:hypothetical protein [Patulibacter sp. DM4]
MQQADEQHLEALGAALQESVREQRPILVVGAGLPAMRELRKLPTCFEHGDRYELGLLDRDATRTALLEPTRASGRPFTEDAGEQLAQRTGGYRYASQVFGHEAWPASNDADAIDLGHLEVAEQRAERRLDQGLYALRWKHASPQERDYLIATAEQEHEVGRAITGARSPPASGWLPSAHPRSARG